MVALQAVAMTGSLPVAHGGLRDWQRWTPHAAVAWSLAYAALVVSWAAGGPGFPYASAPAPGNAGPLLARLGPFVPWLVVWMAGIPAAVVGAAMLRGVRSSGLRRLLMAVGMGLAAVLLLLMTGLDLLVLFGYVPFVLFGFLRSGTIGQRYVEALTEWTFVHQVLCLLGGFLWLAATVAYSRRSASSAGRQDCAAWQRADQAARWGRIAVWISMVAPVFYALTRYAWALGLPLGMSEEAFRSGQDKGIWTSGLFLANFGLFGALLTLGLVQRWGEVFPRWMIGLAGRRVPVALAVIPASFVSVLLLVGGAVLWSGMGQMVPRLASRGAHGMGLASEITFVLGPVLLFPVWGAALAAATLGYVYRRREPCGARQP